MIGMLGPWFQGADVVQLVGVYGPFTAKFGENDCWELARGQHASGPSCRRSAGKGGKGAMKS